MPDSQIAHGPTLSAPPADDAGERLCDGAKVGDYVIDRWLGAGAMGDVYAGRQPVIGKRVAIKVLKRDLAADKEAAERFLREARAVNQVDHPNVIDVFGFGRLDDGRLYLVMDLVDGRSLRKVLEDGPLEVEAALDVLDKIAQALDAAHARGVVHRDLKPDNVMLSSAGQVYVLDFGIAKLVSTSGVTTGTLTDKGTWLGTPGYMAPEQWSADGAGPASDRYALGVMAYELLSGELPFRAPTLPQMMEQHFRAKVPALSERGTTRKPPQHHQTIDPVLSRAMAKTPDDRYPTAKDLVSALRAASAGERVAGARRKRGAEGRSMTVPAVAGVGVLGLVVVGAIVIKRGGDTEVTREPAPPPAAGPTIKVSVTTAPIKAKVARDGVVLGTTPLEITIPAASAKSSLTITKPGYRAVAQPVDATKDIHLSKDLQPITGFEGVWAMPDGKLRGFWRTTGDQVGIYKLKSVSGDRELWRTGQLVDPPTGVDMRMVVFTTTAAMGDERSTDPSCDDIDHAIEYRFDPTAETLEVRAEIVGTAKKDGHCVVASREPGEPIKMVRADTDRGEIHYTQPPVGRLKDPPVPPAPPTKTNNTKPPAKPVQPSPDELKKKAELQKKLDADQKTQVQAKKTVPSPKSKAGKAADDFDLAGDLTNGDKTNAPPPQQAPVKPAAKPVPQAPTQVDTGKLGNDAQQVKNPKVGK